MTQRSRGLFSRLLSLIGGHELGVLIALVAVAAGVWLFIAVASEVAEGETQGIDQKLLLSLRHPGDRTPIGPPAVQDAARDITALGGVAVLTLLTLFTGGFLFLDGKRHMAAFVYLSVASGTLVSGLLKTLFERPRPEIVPHGAYVSTTSFPSGHSMLSALTYLTLAALLARSYHRRRIKAYFLLIAAFLSLLVGISRVYLGVHWPTDVLAGWTAGVTWAIFCWLVARSLQQRHAIESEEELGILDEE